MTSTQHEMCLATVAAALLDGLDELSDELEGAWSGYHDTLWAAHAYLSPWGWKWMHDNKL